MREKQYRSVSKGFETRSDDTGKKFISGYFAVFNSLYEMWEGMTESIAEGAIEVTSGDDIRCLIDHETRLVIGRTTNGTFALKVDKVGLWGEVEINENDQDAVNLYERVKRGDINQCSIGFDIIEELEERDNEKNTVHWTIKKLKLYEGSIVTFPAYEDTAVEARKKQEKTIKKRNFESWKQEIAKRLKGE